MFKQESKMKCRVVLFCVSMLSTLVCFASPSPTMDSPAAAADSFVEAWNSHDRGEFARLFTENAYWVPVVDTRLDGRKAIVADMEKAHETWARNTTMGASDVVVRYLSPEVAVVLLHAGFLDKDGKMMVPANALLLVVVKQAEGWRIAAGQLTKPGSTKLPQP